MEICVKFESPTSHKDFADVLNELAKYLEGNESTPNHWDETKRQQFYKDTYRFLRVDACDMMTKFTIEVWGGITNHAKEI